MNVSRKREVGHNKMMRDRVLTVARNTIIVMFFLVLFSACSYIEHNYIREATVTDRINDEVVCVDKRGYEWSFYVDSEDTLTKGDTIKLKMYDNCTDSYIFDDEITNYVYVE